MPRTLGFALGADVDRVVTSPRLLVQITLTDATVYRYATGDDANNADIVWNAQTWPMSDIKIGGITIQNGGSSSAAITLASNDNVATAVYLGDFVSGAEVIIYYTTALISYLGPNEVVEIYRGEINGDVVVNASHVSLRCEKAVKFTPNKFFNSDSGFTKLTPAGTYNFGIGQIVLERDG